MTQALVESLPLVRASRAFRLSATLLDALFYGGLSLPAAGVMLLGVAGVDVDGTDVFAAGSLGVLVYVLVQAILVARTGQSLGKRLLGLRIVRPDGRPAGFARAVVLRSWLFAVPYAAAQLVPLLWEVAVALLGPSLAMISLQLIPLAGYAILSIDVSLILAPARRCLHDHVADTVVVHSRHWQPA